MAPDRWERIKELFEAALERRPGDRAQFLAEACAGDVALLAEVQRLLAQYEQAGDFLRTPAKPAAVVQRAVGALHTFAPDEIVAGRFRIVRFIGKGGMGEVYEAEDSELHERVALKTIRPEIACDERAIQRFKREIQTARKVAHPNVCRTFDLGYHWGGPGSKTTFLTMELLSGQTLSSRMKRIRRMTAAEALPIVQQMAAGLTAAHRAGIIHRDFKPGNVLLVEPKRAEQTVRAVITDFGLARRSPAGESGVESVSSVEGFAGTPDYMAPEQIDGGETTAAADIYALGVVMYEMVTGERPFKADTPFAAAMKRLNTSPLSPRSHVPDLDPRWEKVILRCLERDAADRYGTAESVVKALEGEPADPARRAATRTAWRRISPRIRWGLSSSAAIAFAGLLVYAYRPAVPAPRLRDSIQLTHDGRPKGVGWDLLIDQMRLYIELDNGPSRELLCLPLSGGLLTRLPVPFRDGVFSDVSADGSAFLVSEQNRLREDYPLYVWYPARGARQPLGNLRGIYPAWSPDGTRIAYCNGDTLWVCRADGTGPKRLATFEGSHIELPHWSPDGSKLSFTAGDPVSNSRTLWTVSADGSDLRQVLPKWNTLPSEVDGVWTPDGKYFVFSSTRNGRADIWAL